MDSDHFEKLFSPHHWVKRLSTNVVLENHIKFSTTGSMKSLKEIPHNLNIPYGNLKNEMYDLFGSDLPNGSKIIIFVHGGYWQEKSINRNNSSYIAKEFYKNKHKTIIIGYNVCPEVSLQEIVNEITQALQKCLEYAKTKNTKAIYLCGHSAGAHLVAMLCNNLNLTLSVEETKIIKKVFLLSGLYNLFPIINTTFNELLKLNEKTAKEVSPMHQKLMIPKHLKIYLFIAEFDSPAFKEQSKLYNEKLNKDGLSSEKILINNVDHFNIVENLTDSDFEATQIIMNLME